MGSIYALASPGGSPGVTTTALALALGWPAPVLVVECDPCGGAILAGALGGHVPAHAGLVEHAIEAGRNQVAAAADLQKRVIPLDSAGTRTLLPGLTDPRQAAGLASAWPAVASTLTAQPCEVIADCGRLDAGQAQPLPVLAAASVMALVLRPTLRQVVAARPRVDMLASLPGGATRLVLLVTGAGAQPVKDIAATLGVPVAAVLPADTRSAAVLSDGAASRRKFGSRPLLVASARAGRALRQRAAAAGGAEAVPAAAAGAC